MDTVKKQKRDILNYLTILEEHKSDMEEKVIKQEKLHTSAMNGFAQETER